MMNAVVVVGAGLAAWNVVKELRKRAPEQVIVMVTADGAESYSKPMLSTAWAQSKTADQLVMSSAEDMAAQLNVEVHARTQVHSIDRSARLLKTSTGDISFDRLVLAVGAEPIRVALEGDAADEVLSVNHLDDYRALRQKVQVGESLAILGGGLIGCEFANDWAKAGYAVTVIDPAALPLSTLLPEAAAQCVKEGLLSLGVEWRGGCVATHVDRAARGYRVKLSDGTTLMVDHVVSAVGLRPAVALAESAGLTVQRGIVVDEYLRTSDSAIYALGDCAEINGAWQPYVMPIMQASRALAATLAGEETAVRFPVMPVMIKTPASPVIVLPVSREAQGQWHIVNASQGECESCFVSKEGYVLGFALVGALSTTRRAAWVTQVGQLYVSQVTATEPLNMM